MTKQIFRRNAYIMTSFLCIVLNSVCSNVFLLAFNRNFHASNGFNFILSSMADIVDSLEWNRTKIIDIYDCRIINSPFAAYLRKFYTAFICNAYAYFEIVVLTKNKVQLFCSAFFSFIYLESMNIFSLFWLNFLNFNFLFDIRMDNQQAI